MCPFVLLTTLPMDVLLDLTLVQLPNYIVDLRLDHGEVVDLHLPHHLSDQLGCRRLRTPEREVVSQSVGLTAHRRHSWDVRCWSGFPEVDDQLALRGDLGPKL